jgi:ADP-heptose:LPS heptosyltransferase
MALRRNVLIFHQGALGDFIVTWPLALALGRLFPQSRVMYVSAREKGLLAERLLRVESVDVVSFTGREPADERWCHNVHEIAPEAELLALQTRQSDASPRHVTEFIADQLSSTPALQAGTMQMLKWINERGLAQAGVKLNPDGPIVIHPGSGSPRKCWPADRFVALARIINSSGKQVRFVIGEVEREQWPRERMDALHRVAKVEQPTTYLELCDLVTQAGGFVGNDSGPAHLAGIVGVPTVTVFGTDATRWHPIGPHVRIVRGDSIDAISLDDVVGAVAGI